MLTEGRFEVGIGEVLARAEQLTVLDRAVAPLQRAVRAIVPPSRVRDALHGTWLGHPTHPALVQLPTALWTSAVVLDRLPGNERAARLLVGLGVLGSLPAALSGATDWSELHEQQMRVGLLHAVANAGAVVLLGMSWVQRGGSHRSAPRGQLAAVAGMGFAAAGAMIGGHLAYRQAAGVNHTEAVPHLVSPGWRPAGRADSVVEGEPTRRMVDDVPVLVLRVQGTVYVLADECSHLSGPLSDGQLQQRSGAWCIVCPWHDSTFALDGGAVVTGPATAPQPSFEVREEGGELLLRLAGAG